MKNLARVSIVGWIKILLAMGFFSYVVGCVHPRIPLSKITSDTQPSHHFILSLSGIYHSSPGYLFPLSLPGSVNSPEDAR
jgi:hypothetical protein